MGKVKRFLTTIAVIVFACVFVGAQTNVPPSCALHGTYRVDVASSDRLYSVVRSATSTVPFGDQQQFFMDLTTRLTPPDMLAIECRGKYVSVGSSRASKITYLADGRNRRERTPDGGFVNSKVTLAERSLTFVSAGKVEDNVNVAFESVDGPLALLNKLHIY